MSADEKDVTGVLYPDFVPRDITRTDKKTGRVFVVNTRPADVVPVLINNVAQVPEGGGTSLYNYPGRMQPAHFWREFRIPEGTTVPPGIAIKERNTSPGHYQIEVASGMMELDAFKGALDTLARSAVARLNALRTV